MLIVGAKGFAKELLEVFAQLNELDHLVFYDDVSTELPDRLYDRFLILKHPEAAQEHFKKTGNNSFALGLSNPSLRMKMSEKFTQLGGRLASVVSPTAHVGHFDVEIGVGTTILTGVIIENGVKIGKGCLINLKSSIAHDTQVGDFAEFAPGASVNGGCVIGSYSQVGSNACLLPKITLGENCVVGAGSVVTTNLPANSVAVGVPSRVIKTLSPIRPTS